MPFIGTYRGFIASSLLSMSILGSFLYPLSTEAGFLSFFGFGEKAEAQTIELEQNSQTIDLPKPIVNPDIIATHGKSSNNDDISIADTLIPRIGPLGNQEEAEERSFDTISVYTVKKGDTLPVIARMLNVSVNTIRWANDLGPKDAIKEGDVLTILPVTGITHTVKKGDTLKSVAKKYGGDTEEIALFNGIDEGVKLAIGTEIIIPDGEEGSIIEKPVLVQNKNKNTPSSNSGKKNTKDSDDSNENLPLYAYGKTRLVKGHDGPAYDGYYIRPIKGGTRTQGLHGWNGIDLSAPLNTPVLAAAGGVVITAKNSGWNTGYANYVVIRHNNGTQTLYAHLNKATVVPGQVVSQGEQIGLLGSTGRSTGPHVHFEVRGGKNPLGDNPGYGL